ncbi:MAG TPA: M28 family peptidase [Rhizomicrobium sp.]|nr:M28 family peptidase [Rhizomicrobium sp.]
MGRIWGLAVLAVGIWLLSVYGQSMPGPLPADAPATAFSQGRADAVLARVLGPERPHPVGSAEAAAVRGRILQELATMGVVAHPDSETSCVSEARWHQVNCATITNIIADVWPGRGKAVLLMAHSDSVAAGPGGGDDGSGVAVLLETIRALKVRGAAGRPVIALFSDGEEPGLIGASAYIRKARDDVAAVVNADVRGDSGASFLFQTSPGDAGLIDLYARGVSHYATSSISGEIYKYLPNDTDLTPALAAGLPGMNFAFIGDVAAYHTPLDRRENIDARSLQEQGDNMLAMADGLRRAPPEQLKSGGLVYLDVLGHWLPRLPSPWALPLSLLAFAVIAVAGFLTPRERHALRRPWLAALMPVLLVAGAVGLGFVLHGLAAWISGHGDPSYAFPVWLRLSLAFGVWTVALLTARLSNATACWLWLAALAIACAIWLPGAVPYFLFPSLVAAPLLLATVRGGREPALLVAALPALLIWIGFAAIGEQLMGLGLHEMFTASLAFGLVSVLPLLRKAWGLGLSCAVSLVLALVLAIVAGFQPAYSRGAPQRLNLHYVERDGKAWWVADPVAHLPDGLRATAHFSTGIEHQPMTGYVAADGAARFPAPDAQVSRQGHDVTLQLDAPGDALALLLPREAGLKSISIGGIEADAEGRVDTINCDTPDCGKMRMTLHLSTTAPFQIVLRSVRHGLPQQGAAIVKARPPEAVPSQGGDSTLLIRTIAIPAGQGA